MQEAVRLLPDPEVKTIRLGDVVEVDFKAISPEEEMQILKSAQLLKPWRKGPFRISKTFIDSEWQSFIKYNLLEPFLTSKIKLSEI